MYCPPGVVPSTYSRYVSCIIDQCKCRSAAVLQCGGCGQSAATRAGSGQARSRDAVADRHAGSQVQVGSDPAHCKTGLLTLQYNNTIKKTSTAPKYSENCAPQHTNTKVLDKA